MRLRITIAVVSIGLALSGCISRSKTDQRVEESRGLSPQVSVTVADPDHFTFLAAGDLHVGGTHAIEKLFDIATSGGDSFIALLGDLVDRGKPEEFQKLTDSIQSKGWAGKVLGMIGNHDVFEDGWELYKTHWGPSSYAVDIGNLRLVALDTADALVGESQAAWVEQQLRERGTRAAALMSHYPPFAPNEDTYLRLADMDEAVHLLKVASAQKVLGWYAGHFHGYAAQKFLGIDLAVAGGLGGRRMGPFENHFCIRVHFDAGTIRHSVIKLD